MPVGLNPLESITVSGKMSVAMSATMLSVKAGGGCSVVLRDVMLERSPDGEVDV